MKQNNKNGAALVIALGFLAILTIMIIAFSAQTRTERLAGRAYLSTAQTRQLLQAALTRALEDIDSAAGTNYPAFLVQSSPLTRTNDSFLANSIDFSMEEDYFPIKNTSISNEYLTALNAARWQSVPDTGSDSIGRVGYIIINTSGLLDANHVGGVTNSIPPSSVGRNQGTSPSEIQLSHELLTELTAGPAPVFQPDGTTEIIPDVALAFVQNRTNAWRRFESLRDLKILNQRGGTLFTSSPQSFSTFSLFPSNTTLMIDLSTPVNSTAFKKRLTASCGLNTIEAQAVYENYIDYTDADNIPHNILGSSPEAVPMINEFWVDNFTFIQTAQDSTNISYEISGELHAEVWYPFEGTPPPSAIQFFSADPSAISTNRVEVITGQESIGATDSVTIDVTYSNGIVKSFILDLDEIASDLGSSSNFTTSTREFSYNDTVILHEPFAGETAPPPSSILVKQEALEVDNLDRVENIELELTYDTGGSLENQYASCIDPRINHDFSDTRLWIIDALNTPNAPNDITDWGEESDLTDKSNIRFYVRNAPMKNAAELGNLSTGKPWETVRLYGQELHPILDHFHAGEALWDAQTRLGLINLNSPHSDVLATAFLNTPIRIDPENKTPHNRVSLEQSRRMADNLARLTAKNPQQDISFIGNAIFNNVPGWPELNDLEKESIIANSYRLFGWRDSLFTILLATQNGTDINKDGIISDDEVRSTQKAVVYVWRDPKTKQAACVFYGLSDTLQSTIGSGQKWSDLLQAFKP